LDTGKSITFDLVNNASIRSHPAYGSVLGLNALFPDGHVRFQNAGLNPQPFQIWTNYESGAVLIGNDSPPSKTWRTVVSLWQP